MEKLELSDLNYKKLWDVVSTLVIFRGNDIQTVQKLKGDMEQLKQNQLIEVSDVSVPSGRDNCGKKRKVTKLADDELAGDVFATPQEYSSSNPEADLSKTRREQQVKSAPMKQRKTHGQTPVSSKDFRKMPAMNKDPPSRRMEDAEQQVSAHDRSKGTHGANNVRSYASVTQSSGDGFQQAGGNRRRHRPPKVFRGQNTDAGQLITSEKRVHFCISGLAPSTVDDQVKVYVSEKIGAKVLEVELIKNRYERYVTHKMFRVTIGASDVPKMTNPALWHQNLSVRRYRMVPPTRLNMNLNEALSNGASSVTQSSTR